MTYIAQQVSRAIRILRGNRDESARASHLMVEKDLLMTYETDFLGQAETEKYSQSTFSERKIMSTKTAFKRVALVAAAALAIGGISAVSAYAGSSTYTNTVTSGTSTITGTGTATGSITVVAGNAVNFNIANTVTTPTATETEILTPVLTGTHAGSFRTVANLAPSAGTLANETYSAVASTGVATLTTTASTGTTTGVVNYTFTPDVPGTYVLTFTGTGTAATYTGAPALTITATASTTQLINGSNASSSVSAVTGNYVSENFFAGTNDNVYTITSTGVGSVNYPAAGTANGGQTSTLTATGTSEVWNSGSSAVALGTGLNFGGSEYVAASVFSAVAGTQVVTIKGNSSAAITLTITWGAAPSFSAAYSTAINNNVADAAANAATSDDTLSVAKTAIAGDIAVVIKNGCC